MTTQSLSPIAFQDRYADSHANCFGCGRNNTLGLQIKSYRDGDETVCRYTPPSHYTGGVPNFLYGGMIASLFDCHGAATAAAAKTESDTEPLPRFVTASLKVDFLAPTPIKTELEIRGKAVEVKDRKVVVELKLLAGEKVCATGQTVMVQLKEK
jgi:acyl-coenzyme A thioesterase PaaI-like protein